MTIFSPTYLYIKQHIITGKLYFGKTIRNPETYLGSGKHWSKHIAKYGKEHVVTLWFQLYDNPFDLVADALSMSRGLDIVNSKSWLNLIEENGRIGGALFKGKRHSEETKTKMSNAQLGNKKFLGKTHSAETRLKISLTRAGMLHSAQTKTKMSEFRKNKANYLDAQGNKYYLSIDDPLIKQKHLVGQSKNKKLRYSENARKKSSENLKIAREAALRELTCPHCGKTAKQNMKRYHFDNCKLLKMVI